MFYITANQIISETGGCLKTQDLLKIISAPYPKGWLIFSGFTLQGWGKKAMKITLRNVLRQPHRDCF
ncbi:MAG: hypothetical protein CVU05_09500 [Bacteroidetes bacterium HGW-Bacteroidetes-21]|jgi:hypothetical protein|nr:MAG: hypothetical protein CVU05_09500 [Bacteroidetes bacterium HGW-Bacteroidetes-21]